MSVFGVISRWYGREFEYGTSDCCQFAGEIVEEVTGNNPMDAFNYSGERGAKSLIRQYGDLFSAVKETLGDPVGVDLAEDGDVLLVEGDRGQAVATCYRGRAVGLTPNGPMDWPIEYAQYCWKIRCRS